MITLSIIIPVYNEEKTIAHVLETIFKIQLPSYEIIVVNDGSTDETLKKIRSVKNELIKIISHKANQGKGMAIQTGIKAASGKYILLHDADLEYDPRDLPKLMKQLPEKNDKVAVYGSRFMKKNVAIPLLYLWGNKFLTWLTNTIYGSSLTDMETGYKLLPAKYTKMMNLKRNRFDIEPEITIKLLQNKIKIIEVPISYNSRTRFAGKKLTPADALSAIRTIISMRYYRM